MTLDGSVPYFYLFAGPQERGNYIAKITWTDIYGNEYRKEIPFFVNGIPDKKVPVKISTSIDNEERIVVSLLRETVIQIRAKMSGSGVGIMEMHMALYWDDSDEKIWEKVYKSNDVVIGSNSMLYNLTWNTTKCGRVRFEITTLDYWGETTVKKFVKEFVAETGNIYITSTLDAEQVVKSDAVIKVSSYCSNGDGIRSIRAAVTCKETRKRIASFGLKSSSENGTRVLNVVAELKNKVSPGYYTMQVTAEDVKGNTETKEWLVKVVG